MTADAAQTGPFDQTGVGCRLINWYRSCPQSNIGAANKQSPASAAHMEITCEQCRGQIDQNKWCFCVVLVAGGCRVTLSRCCEGAAVAITETK